MWVTTRVLRTVKVGWTAAVIWASYKIPALHRRLRGVAFTSEQLSPTHARAASRILALAAFKGLTVDGLIAAQGDVGSGGSAAWAFDRRRVRKPAHAIGDTNH